MRQQLVQLGGGAHALAMQLLGNAEDAADAVQDAFATALSRPDRYDASKGPLKPWFLRVVRNRCLDMLRRRRPTDSAVDGLSDGSANPEHLVRDAQRVTAIRSALACLPPDRREIIVLRDYMDLSYGEIADVLGIAPGTVMSRLHRARMALREVLETDEDN